jgi:hypothetical protein
MPSRILMQGLFLLVSLLALAATVAETTIGP